jgi:protein arginine kinase activator
VKCDLCNKPAVVHEVQITNGVKREIHLCQMHASEAGFADGAGMTIQNVSTKVGSAAVRSPSCPTCGTTVPQIRQSSLLGCPDCYETFDGPVSGIIEQNQPGGTCHVGRRPAGTDADIARLHETQRLMRDLEAAVASEQYERAAQIRDALAKASRRNSA